jgi:hypothetical protein
LSRLFLGSIDSPRPLAGLASATDWTVVGSAWEPCTTGDREQERPALHPAWASWANAYTYSVVGIQLSNTP